MIFTLIGWLLLAIGIICLLINKKYFNSAWDRDTFHVLGTVFIVVGGMWMLIMGIFIVQENINVEGQRSEILEQRAAIIAMVEEYDNVHAYDENAVVRVNLEFYNEILKNIRKFNNGVKEYRIWSKHPLQNWLYNIEIYEGVDYIQAWGLGTGEYLP